MRFETVTYSPGESLDEIKRQLPDWVNEQLMDYPRCIYVTVETHKKDVIEYLDKFFKIGKSYDCVKRYFLEIDKSEIPNFEYFHIIPDVLILGKHIFGNIIRPTCSQEACSFGSKLLSPLRITSKKAKRVGIAQLHRPWGQTYEFIISSQLKNIFDSEGITGLEYEQCVIDDGPLREELEVPPPYLARISHKISRHAEHIIPGNYICKKHSVMSSFSLINSWLSREEMNEDDFQAIDKMIVKGKVYNLHGEQFRTSRKALELLLKHKIRGLVPIGFFLGHKFLPETTISDKVACIPKVEPVGTPTKGRVLNS